MTLSSTWNQIKTSVKIKLMEEVAKEIVITSTTKGINGFELSITQDEEVSLQSQVTDYYVENNSALQDNIAVAPLRFRVTGKIAEKVSSKEKELAITEFVANKLTPVSFLLPDFASYVIDALVTADQVASAVDEATSIVDFITGQKEDSSLTEQQKAFNFFYSAWKARELLTVRTAFFTAENCVIENLTMSQPANTKSYADVEISFKQIQIASSEQVVAQEKRADRNADQSLKGDDGAIGADTLVEAYIDPLAITIPERFIQ